MDVLVDGAVNVFIVSGVAWPYIAQGRQIIQSRNPSAFSLTASLIIIVSASIRAFYWIGARFPVVFLAQALVAIVAQLCMIYVVCHTQREVDAAADAAAGRRPRRSICSASGMLRWREHFWAWDDVTSFVLATGIFGAILAALQYVCGRLPHFVEAQGIAGLGLEALLPLPQAIRNYQRRSTAGLSSVLIVAWLGGDIFKTVISLQRGAPWPFAACGIFQAAIDLVILGQILSYPSGSGDKMEGGGGHAASSSIGGGGGGAGDGESGGVASPSRVYNRRLDALSPTSEPNEPLLKQSSR